MHITLCGSARFEDEFKEANKQLTLKGHVVYSLAVYPSDEDGKHWYTPKEKETLDRVHKLKIDNSDAIVVIHPSYIGESTQSEIAYARKSRKAIFWSYKSVLRAE